MSTALALIPARGGSRSVPMKNITDLAGRPRIAYTIETALAARCVTRVIVTTDSERIAETARTHGAEVPFMRPEALARDDSPAFAYIHHAVAWLDQHEQYRPDCLVLLQPTSPFRAPEDIDSAVDILLATGGKAVVSVCAAPHHPYWMQTIAPDGRLQPFTEQDMTMLQRQAHPPVYVRNGSVYVAEWNALSAMDSFNTDATFGYVMPEERSLDIDSPWHLHLARLIMEARAS